MTHALYPLKFQPALKEKVWGGHKLESILHLPQTQRNIGEAWLVHEGLLVDNGAWRGRTLAQLTQQFGDALLGAHCAGLKDFPLLIKFLDPQEFLSVQNHPDDAYAQKNEGVPFGKNEAWYVLQADANAQLIHGLKGGLTRDELRYAMHTGTLMQHCDYVSAQTGDVFINTAGVVHALGTGIVIYEVQQSSDITYRLYDWDRQPKPGEPVRELHIEKGADVADLRPIQKHKIAPVILHDPDFTRMVLVACEYYAAEKIEVHTQLRQHPRGQSFHILTVLAGQGTVRAGGVTVEVSSGESVLVPACLDAYDIDATSPSLTLIKAYVPDLLQDIVQPLREHGVSDAHIAHLGGDELRSVLGKLL